MRKLMKRFKKLKNERGLTLVELLAVIVILAIVAIIAFVFIGGVIENSKKDAHISNAMQIIQAAKLHEATGGDVNEMTVGKLQEKDYLDVIYDPWTKDEYGNDAMNAKITKEKGLLKINNFKDSGGNCNITATEQELSKKDRDELCKKETE